MQLSKAYLINSHPQISMWWTIHTH